jgi:release factor glutamine methyltransferase
MAPQTAARLIASATARLGHLANPSLDAELLLRGLTGLSRADLLARADEPVDGDAAAAYEAALARREQHEPVQYILGRAAFWRDEFVVNPAVLIPRPDTEILVEAVAARLRDVEAPRLLDIGTGSGCIALSLLRELPRARALAVDVSGAALDVARTNAATLGLESRIDFLLSCWLGAVPEDGVFDAVVSNPPYVAPAERSMLSPEVREFEPALALFAEDADDLSSYRAIVGQVGGHLKPSGILAFEVGLGQATRVADILRDHGLASVETVNDLARIARVVLARRS